MTSQDDFNKSYKAYIELARDLAKQAGIPLTLDTPDVSGIKTHNYASRTGHGSDHVDPIAFLAKWGVSYAQLKNDIENGIDTQNVTELLKKGDKNMTIAFNYNGIGYSAVDGVMIAFTEPKYWSAVNGTAKSKGVYVDLGKVSKAQFDQLVKAYKFGK